MWIWSRLNWRATVADLAFIMKIILIITKLYHILVFSSFSSTRKLFSLFFSYFLLQAQRHHRHHHCHRHRYIVHTSHTHIWKGWKVRRHIGEFEVRLRLLPHNIVRSSQSTTTSDELYTTTDRSWQRAASVTTAASEFHLESGCRRMGGVEVRRWENFTINKWMAKLHREWKRFPFALLTHPPVHSLVRLLVCFVFHHYFAATIVAIIIVVVCHDGDDDDSNGSCLVVPAKSCERCTVLWLWKFVERDSKRDEVQRCGFATRWILVNFVGWWQVLRGRFTRRPSSATNSISFKILFSNRRHIAILSLFESCSTKNTG